MTVYYLTIGAIFILSILAMAYPQYKVQDGINTHIKEPSFVFVFFIMLILISVYTLRWCNGTDYYNYYLDFQKMKYVKMDYILKHRDILFSLLTYYTYKLSNGNFIIYNMILGILIYVPVVLTLKKQSSNFLVTMLLYIFMTLYFTPFNTIRQGIACSICFYAYNYINQHEYMKFVVMVLVASMFHSTALILIPILLFLNEEFFSNKIKLAILLSIFVFINLDSLWSYFIEFLNLIGQSKIASDYKDSLLDENGVNIYRVIVAFLPTVISYIFYNKIKQSNEGMKNIDFMMNMSIFSAIFILFGIKFAVIARVSQYFEIYNVLLYPYILKCFDIKARRFVTFSVLVLYFVYMSVLLPSGGDIVPYQYYYDYENKWMIDVNLEDFVD